MTELFRPKPVKWSPSYTSSDKIPFGCYVLHQEIDDLFPESGVKTIYQNPYLQLNETDTIRSAYVFINSYMNFDAQETGELLDYVFRGNSVFIAAGTLGPTLRDTLNLAIHTSYRILEEPLHVKYVNPGFKQQEFTYKKNIYKHYITAFDTLNTTVLGYTLAGKKQEHVNFIKVQHGNGYFYINTLPQAYTNYYMLNGNKTYVSNALSYISDNEVYWDEYKKDGRVVISSPMRYVLNNGSLRWAYYLVITSLLLFVLFKGKRQQRIIPVITPLENSSVEFTKTISSLYYQHKNYSDISLKRIRFFLANVRSHYYLDTAVLSPEFGEKLALKSGVSEGKATKLVTMINRLREKKQHTEEDIIALDKHLEHFKF